MNSTESFWIHSCQSSFVATCDTSQACLRCCWLTAIFVDSAGAWKSVALELSLALSMVSIVMEQENVGSQVKHRRLLRQSLTLQQLINEVVISQMRNAVAHGSLRSVVSMT